MEKSPQWTDVITHLHSFLKLQQLGAADSQTAFLEDEGSGEGFKARLKDSL